MKEIFRVAFSMKVRLTEAFVSIFAGEYSGSLLDNRVHQLEVQWNASLVQMKLDQCLTKKNHCWASWPLHNRRHSLLNTANTPVQLGGVDADLSVLKDAFGWQSLPTSRGFRGCIRNLTFNGRVFNLVAPVHLHSPADVSSTEDGATFGVPGIVSSVLLIGIVMILILSFLIVYYVYLSPSEHYNKLRSQLGTKSTPASTLGREMNVIYAQDEKLMNDEPLHDEQ